MRVWFKSLKIKERKSLFLSMEIISMEHLYEKYGHLYKFEYV